MFFCHPEIYFGVKFHPITVFLVPTWHVATWEWRLCSDVPTFVQYREVAFVMETLKRPESFFPIFSDVNEMIIYHVYDIAPFFMKDKIHIWLNGNVI